MNNNNNIHDKKNNNNIIEKSNDIEVLEDSMLEKLHQHTIPPYLIDVYNWAYVDPKNINRLDNPFIYHLILFGQGSKLMKMYLDEIKEGDKVLQVAHVYGNLVKHIAKKVGNSGSLDIIDVVPHQLVRAQEKLKSFSNVDMWLQDAATPYHRKYNVIGIYFLLHEVPDNIKKQIIENALKQIDENDSKIVFIDYHHPHFFHPVRPILSLVNTFLEPFAHSIWNREIQYFTNKYQMYNWQKTTIFGGVYQKVVVTKKKNP